MSSITDRSRPAGLADAWATAVNIDLSTVLAVSRASARAIADLSPEAAKAIAARLNEEAEMLDANSGLGSSTAAMIVRRTLDKAA